MAIDQEFYDTVKQGLAKSESSNNYYLQPNSSGAMGKYQFTRGRLEDLGYGKYSNQEFISNPALQEEIMQNHLEDINTQLSNKGLINDASSKEDVAGLMWSAHLGGLGGAEAVAKGKQGASDSLGTSVNAYFEKGKKQFLKANGLLQDSEFSAPKQGLGFAATGEYQKSLQNPATAAYPQGAWDLASSGFEAADAQTASGIGKQVKATEQEVIDSIGKKAGVDFSSMVDKKFNELRYSGAVGLLNRISDIPSPLGFENSNLKDFDRQKAFNSALDELKKSNPSLSLPESYNEVKKQAGAVLEEKEKSFAKDSSNTGWLPWLSGAVGTMAGYLKDPKNLAVMAATGPIAPAAGLVKGIATRAAANVLGEFALVQPEVQTKRADLGLEAGLGDAAVNSLMVGVGGIGLELAGKTMGAFLRGGKSSFTKLKERLSPIENKTPQEESLLSKATHAEDVIGSNPAGDTPEGISHLDSVMSKAEDDLYKGGKIDAVEPGTQSTYIPSSREKDGILSLAKDNEFGGDLKKDAEGWDAFKKQVAEATPEEIANSPIKPIDAASGPKESFLQQKTRQEVVDTGRALEEQLRGTKALQQSIKDTELALLDRKLTLGEEVASEKVKRQQIIESDLTGTKEFDAHTVASEKKISALDVELAKNTEALRVTRSNLASVEAALERNKASVAEVADKVNRLGQAPSIEKDNLLRDQEALTKYTEAQSHTAKVREAEIAKESFKLEEQKRMAGELSSTAKEVKSLKKATTTEDKTPYIKEKEAALERLQKEYEDLAASGGDALRGLIESEDRLGRQVTLTLDEFNKQQKEDLNILQQLKDCIG